MACGHSFSYNEKNVFSCKESIQNLTNEILSFVMNGDISFHGAP